MIYDIDPQFEDLQLDINHFDVVIENNQNYGKFIINSMYYLSICVI